LFFGCCFFFFSLSSFQSSQVFGACGLSSIYRASGHQWRFCFILFYFVFVVLCLEPRVWHMLLKHSAQSRSSSSDTEPHFHIYEPVMMTDPPDYPKYFRDSCLSSPFAR
jgi:hypothetical protein